MALKSCAELGPFRNSMDPFQFECHSLNFDQASNMAFACHSKKAVNIIIYFHFHLLEDISMLQFKLSNYSLLIMVDWKYSALEPVNNW